MWDDITLFCSARWYFKKKVKICFLPNFAVRCLTIILILTDAETTAVCVMYVLALKMYVRLKK